MRSTEHHLLQHVRTLLSKISPPQLPYMADRVDDKAPLLQPCNDTYTDSSGGRSEGKRQVVSSLVSGDEARSPGGNNDGKGNRAKLDDASPEKAPSAIASGSVNLICFVMVLDLMTITVQVCVCFKYNFVDAQLISLYFHSRRRTSSFDALDAMHRASSDHDQRDSPRTGQDRVFSNETQCCLRCCRELLVRAMDVNVVNGAQRRELGPSS